MSTRVRVHFNLRTHLWSITAMSGPNRGRVVQHSAIFALTCCEFIVSETGRQRVLAKHERQVHAWVEGLVVQPVRPSAEGRGRVQLQPVPREHFHPPGHWATYHERALLLVYRVARLRVLGRWQLSRTGGNVC